MESISTQGFPMISRSPFESSEKKSLHMVHVPVDVLSWQLLDAPSHSLLLQHSPSLTRLPCLHRPESHSRIPSSYPSGRVLLNGNSEQPTSPPPPSRHAQRSPRLTAIPGIDHDTCRPGRERGFKAKSKRKRCVLGPRVAQQALLRFLDPVFAQGERTANWLGALQLATSYNELLEYVMVLWYYQLLS